MQHSFQRLWGNIRRRDSPERYNIKRPGRVITDRLLEAWPPRYENEAGGHLWGGCQEGLSGTCQGVSSLWAPWLMPGIPFSRAQSGDWSTWRIFYQNVNTLLLFYSTAIYWASQLHTLLTPQILHIVPDTTILVEHRLTGVCSKHMSSLLAELITVGSHYSRSFCSNIATNTELGDWAIFS